MDFFIENHWKSIYYWIIRNKFKDINFPQFYLFGINLGYDTADIDEEIHITFCLLNFSFHFNFRGTKIFDIIDPEYIKDEKGNLIKRKRDRIK